MLIALLRCMSNLLVAAATLVALAGACTTSAPAPESSASSMPMVSRIELSRTVGHVGQKFKAEVSMHSRDLGDAEIRVRSLPPGLLFNEETKRITGIPEADGFFSVTIAVRKKRGPGIHFSTPEGAWFSERLDIDIYRPIDEGSERASYDEGSLDVAASE